jgi:hypothetical protein
MVMPIDLLEQMKTVFDAANVVGGSLNGDVKLIDWGGWIPPLPSTLIPFIFLTIDNSLHPIKRVAAGTEQAYNEEYMIFIHVGSYIIKGSDGEEGYKAALREPIGIVRSVITLCHINRNVMTHIYQRKILLTGEHSH